MKQENEKMINGFERRDHMVRKKKWFAALMAMLITMAYMPFAIMSGATEASAATSGISVTLSKSSSPYTYGGSGLAYQYTVVQGGVTRSAYCLEPDKLVPPTGSHTASLLTGNAKVSNIMYYCYGYPGQNVLSSWLQNNGYSSYSSGTNLYLFSHVLVSYQYNPSGAFTGWQNGSPNVTINSDYQTAIKNASAYLNGLTIPAGLDNSFSFKADNGNASNATWTEDGEFKSGNITMDGNAGNSVTMIVPKGMTLHMDGKEYAAGTPVTINGGKIFYFTTSDISYRNSTYSSGRLKGSASSYSAYRINGSGYQNMGFFAVGDVSSADFSIKFGDVDIDIGTTASDAKTGNSQGIISEDAVLIDEVAYEKLTPGKEYRIEGVLMNKDTEKPVEINGKIVTAVKTFTPEKSSGTVKLRYVFDSSVLKGESVVVFEDIYQGDVKLASHADISDEGQTVDYPDLGTKATDQKTGTNIGTIAKNAVIKDAVSYHNLLIGKEYTAKGKLMDSSTGKPLLVNGKEITAERTFTAEKKTGKVDLFFTLDSTDLAGKTVVVYENLYHEGVKIGSHADISDKGQSITYPINTPKTGDDGDPIFLFLALAITGIAVVLMLISRHSGDDEEE